MSVISRLFGNKSKLQQTDEALVENPDIKDSLSLGIVFKNQFCFDEDKLLKILSNLDVSMKGIRCNKPFGQFEEGYYALFGWGKHVIKVVGVNAPYPEDSLEICVGPAHYSQEIKAQIRNNDSHLILYYVGYEKDVLEQYLALTRLAAGFESFNALAVINEYGYTSLPIIVISDLITEKNVKESLCDCLLMFFCGFVKYEVENVNGVWMRTYGADVFGLPDFAVLANSHDESEHYFMLFQDILNYLRKSGATMVAGDTMEYGDDNKVMFLRSPLDEEYYLKDKGNVIVIEMRDK